jgi:hypothetical protein
VAKISLLDLLCSIAHTTCIDNLQQINQQLPAGCAANAQRGHPLTMNDLSGCCCCLTRSHRIMPTAYCLHAALHLHYCFSLSTLLFLLSAAAYRLCQPLASSSSSSAAHGMRGCSRAGGQSISRGNTASTSSSIHDDQQLPSS